jgi:2-polyprenyl-3-methyl-5-hydroxy-6-metoxy-1,4-benzoquinol methylase
MASIGRGPFDQFAEAAHEFEQTVLEQQPFEPSHYDGDYFASDWREGDNRYELETRRRIEDRNPKLITEVFEPRALLDVGCGPGFLMQFVHELGVEVAGVDFSPASLELAPPEMRDRIQIGPTDHLDFADRSFDLVVCREVLEHLTVLQVRRTVAEICRVTARFAYITTRFHTNPQTLLDVATDFETDPTHITLLTKDFVRCLFVLEGLRSRPDLERSLDWARKGRVLVYERSTAS